MLCFTVIYFSRLLGRKIIQANTICSVSTFFAIIKASLGNVICYFTAGISSHSKMTVTLYGITVLNICTTRSALFRHLGECLSGNHFLNVKNKFIQQFEYRSLHLFMECMSVQHFLHEVAVFSVCCVHCIWELLPIFHLKRWTTTQNMNLDCSTDGKIVHSID